MSRKGILGGAVCVLLVLALCMVSARSTPALTDNLAEAFSIYRVPDVDPFPDDDDESRRIPGSSSHYPIIEDSTVAYRLEGGKVMWVDDNQ